MRNVIQALVVFLILLCCGGIFILFIVKVREAATRAQCTNNLKQLGLSIHNYASTYNGRLPAADIPNSDLPVDRRLSWLVSIVPYVEASNLYNKMETKKGWDAEENRFAALMVYRIWHCPGHRESPPVSTLVPTDYVGITGIGIDAATLPLTDPRAGFFGYERNPILQELKRGTAQILLAVETSQTSGAWTAAGPPTSRGLEPNGAPYFGLEGQFGGNHPRGANMVFVDGSVRFIEETIDPAVWEAMATLSGKGNQE